MIIWVLSLIVAANRSRLLIYTYLDGSPSLFTSGFDLVLDQSDDQINDRVKGFLHVVTVTVFD